MFPGFFFYLIGITYQLKFEELPQESKLWRLISLQVSLLWSYEWWKSCAKQHLTLVQWAAHSTRDFWLFFLIFFCFFIFEVFGSPNPEFSWWILTSMILICDLPWEMFCKGSCLYDHVSLVLVYFDFIFDTGMVDQKREC